MSERQHGLTATLLSNMAIRSGEIVDSIRSRRSHPIVTMAEREIANAD